MKKLSLILCSMILFLFTTPQKCFADEYLRITNEVTTISETFADGSYLVITLSELETPLPCSNIYTKTGSKTVTYRSSDGTEQWSFTVTGTFEINSGVSARCTSSTYSYTISNSSWHLDSASSSYSGSQAFGEAVFKKKVLFITTETKSAQTSISCDFNGNLS